MADAILPRPRWPGAVRPWHRLALAAAAGAVAALGQVPVSLVPLGLAGLALGCATVLSAPGWRGAATAGWALGVGYFAVTLHWIVEPFLVDVARHGWMAPFALVFTAAGFALFWGAAAGLARRLCGGAGWRGPLGWAVAMAAAEALRSTILTGFPWALTGYVWSEGPAAQIAAVTGAFGLTLLTLLLAAAVAAAVCWGLAAGALALAAAWVGPLALGAAVAAALPPLPPTAPDAPTVRLVQPNAPQRLKWHPDHAPGFFARQLGYTAAAGAPDLTIWPETSIPYLLTEDHPALRRIAAEADGRPVVVGAQRLDGVRAYNSLAVVGAGGALLDLYDKHHLVPFGEFMPLGDLAAALGISGLAARDGNGFSAGPGPRLIDLGPLGRALPLICYETIFPRNVAGAPERPDWLLQITNDAWFGTFSGPYQHLAQARMRAIEFGLPMLRAANTGVSAVIDARGRVLAEIPLGAAGYLDRPLPPAAPPTIHARTGHWPFWIVLGVLAIATFRPRGA
ncbi:apolipoprotein N-acyltransferase [Rhodobacteraceae bacterium CCMM004]|nr:apolipoprotein N-acyltransferase [Rhodobacteraceae bacterium CCMM004]